MRKNNLFLFFSADNSLQLRDFWESLQFARQHWVHFATMGAGGGGTRGGASPTIRPQAYNMTPSLSANSGAFGHQV